MMNENRESSKTDRTIECEGARAQIVIQESKHSVFIEDLQAQATGQGSGSNLLNMIKLSTLIL